MTRPNEHTNTTAPELNEAAAAAIVEGIAAEDDQVLEVQWAIEAQFIGK